WRLSAACVLAAACRAGDPEPSHGEETSTAHLDAGSVHDSVCRIRTRDGIELRTWLGLPDPVPAGGVPVVLWRTPYRVSRRWSDQSNADFAAFLNARGYAFVLQDVRGRPDSTGSFAVLRHEIEDGQ